MNVETMHLSCLIEERRDGKRCSENMALAPRGWTGEISIDSTDNVQEG